MSGPAPASTSPGEPLQRLARTFPSLRSAEGIDPWDPQRLYRWASRGTTSFEAAAAAEFVLALRGADFLAVLASLRRLLQALSSWDAGDRAAFSAWAAAPWWPEKTPRGAT